MKLQLPDHLYGFQREDAARLLEEPRRLLLLPMGAGKSVIAIAAAEACDAFTIVIVCPAILRADWWAKFVRFGRQNYSFNPADRGRRVIVCSYESLNSPERRARLLNDVRHIDVLILDEAQRLKNPDARITHSIYGVGCDGSGLAALARHVWVVSGTLCLNHWGELWTHLRANFPHKLLHGDSLPVSYEGFLDRYTVWETTPWGNVKVKANRSPDQLREMLQGIAVYRPPEDVLKLLPRLRVTTTPIELAQHDEMAYEVLAGGPEGRQLQAVLDSGFDLASWEETDSIAAARHQLGLLKCTASVEYISELLADDPTAAVLVFAHHRDVMARLARGLRDVDPNVSVIDGTTPDHVRARHIEEFQAGRMRVLVLGIATAREGVTLTAANRVVLVEASWTPAHNNQAIARAHRIGQERPVIAEYLTVPDTLDEAVTAVCARKSQQLSEVL